MTLYEVIDKVSRDLALHQCQFNHHNQSELAHQISTYLKDSMDDNIEFTRSRYCKRTDQEGPIPNRELGTIQYILYGCNKAFHTDYIRYIKHGEINQATDLQLQIIWGKHLDNIQEDTEFCEGVGFPHIAVIPMNQEK